MRLGRVFGALSWAALSSLACADQPPSGVLDQLVAARAGLEHENTDTWFRCVLGMKAATDSLCTGERAGIVAISTNGRGPGSALQAMTGQRMTAAAVESWANERFGPSTGGCTLDSAGVRTDVRHWRAPDRSLVEVAATPDLPGAVITISDGRAPAFPCAS